MSLLRGRGGRDRGGGGEGGGWGGELVLRKMVFVFVQIHICVYAIPYM